MRIGIITGEYPPMQGGVGAYSSILADYFAEQGHDVFVLTSKSAKSVGTKPILTNSIEKWGFSNLSTAKNWAKQNRLDVINLQFQTAAFGMSPYIHFLPQYIRDIPIVTTFHDFRFPYLFPKAGMLRDWIVMHLARSSAGAIVTNHEDFERVKHLPHRTLIPIGSNILTPLPADFSRQTWREKAGTHEDDFLLAHFGFINRIKGIEPLLHAMAALRKENLPIKLVMIGGRTGTSDPTNAAYVQEIDALIERLELAPHVYWTGYITEGEVSAYLEASDVVTLPFLDGASYRRGSLMAAIHHGSAILTTKPKVTIPTFVDQENMLLVPIGNTNALAQGIHELYETPDLREKLRQSVKKLDSHFDWSTIARDSVAFFEERRLDAANKAR